ncbi:hypothetical protein AK830_g7242 [Neonectria ditissima]|uniref:Uncharacterized protein n=1 Tax=Neonectria ditissima TaxID=78410 RepID=A0A0P7B032_9HYPO|nr:hypothetical protein AK830_g7242 [Neonectria ditissima]
MDDSTLDARRPRRAAARPANPARAPGIPALHFALRFPPMRALRLALCPFLFAARLFVSELGASEGGYVELVGTRAVGQAIHGARAGSGWRRSKNAERTRCGLVERGTGYVDLARRWQAEAGQMRATRSTSNSAPLPYLASWVARVPGVGCCWL